MSNTTLRAIYAAMVSARSNPDASLPRAQQAAFAADVACFASPLANLRPTDAVFHCRHNPGLTTPPSEAEIKQDARPHPLISGGVPSLYAAIGAAIALQNSTVKRRPSPVTIAFFERHDLTAPGFFEALPHAAELPLLLVVLPRWKGREDALSLGAKSRDAGVPGISVDAEDAVALYRVAQESLIRARARGGAALIEAVRLPRPDANEDALTRLGAYLLRRRAASEAWMNRIGQPSATFPVLPKTKPRRR